MAYRVVKLVRTVKPMIISTRSFPASEIVIDKLTKNGTEGNYLVAYIKRTDINSILETTMSDATWNGYFGKMFFGVATNEFVPTGLVQVDDDVDNYNLYKGEYAGLVNFINNNAQILKDVVTTKITIVTAGQSLGNLTVGSDIYSGFNMSILGNNVGDYRVGILPMSELNNAAMVYVYAWVIKDSSEIASSGEVEMSSL